MNQTDSTTLGFDESGVHYHAEKGLAYAEEDGRRLWTAGDVFTKSAPTRESLLSLADFPGWPPED